MGEKTYFEDFQVGDRLRSPGRTVTDADRSLFALIVGPDAPMELLLLAMASGLMARAGGLSVPPATIALRGIPRARFVAPVRPGDTVHLESKVEDVTAVDGERGLLTVTHRARTQSGEDVLALTSQMLVGRRPPEGEREGG